VGIGELIKYHRTNQNLSMNTLAKKANVGQSGLSSIEAGKRQPTFDILDRIVRALNLTWAEFFQEAEPEFTPEVRDLLDNVKTLTPEQVEALNQFIHSIKGSKE